MKKLVPAFILFALFPWHLSYGCTAFCLKKANETYLAKNLDWSIDFGFMFLNERGITKSVLNPGLFYHHEFSWRSKYRSITFNQFGKDFPLGGMNEMGLVVEELNMERVEIIPDSTKYNINEFQLVQYILDQCGSVSEVTTELQKFQLIPVIQYLHYLIADQKGNVFIVEYDGSGFCFYDARKTGVPVLSNNRYLSSLKYLKNFKGFGGDLPVLNRKGSNERFVTAANFLAAFHFRNPIGYSFEMLDTLKQTDTKWSLVYNLKNRTVYFRFHNCPEVKVFDFKASEQLPSVSGLGGNLTDCKFDGNEGLKRVTEKENARLIQKVLSCLAEENGIEMNEKLLEKMRLLSGQNLN